MYSDIDLHSLVSELRTSGKAFALATVVRTISVTAAKAGAKAVIDQDGVIVAGWIGGGCARSAVLKAAKTALETGETLLVSVQPQDLLGERGVEPGETREGIRFARNMCPSQGTMDIFVEPVLPQPEIIIFGASPVAVALAGLGRRMGYSICVCSNEEDQRAYEDVESRITDLDMLKNSNAERYVVVSTQGRGDEAALKAALGISSRYACFVGSRKKFGFLREKLASQSIPTELIDSVKAPAGLDIGAITPDEIAFSILGEIIACRRSGQRQPAVSDG